MLLFCIRDTETDEYLISGQWGEEPEWFQAHELKALKIDRPNTVTESHDFSATEWAA